MRYDFRLPRSINVTDVTTIANADTEQIKDWGYEFLQPEKVYHLTKGEGSIVFILDTAGEFTHPDLIENCLPEYNRNFSNSKTKKDVQKHGTHCAGIVAAKDNKKGIIGVAPNSKLVAIKVLNDKGQGLYKWVIDALEYVASLEIKGYKKIINLSLSGGVGSKGLHNAIIYAASKGCFIVAAAGNSGYRKDQNSIGWPARYDEVLSVASITEEGVSHFSSGGKEIDLAAPGSSIYSTYPPNRYVKMDGTSMAAPQIAGIIALVLGLHPYIENQEQLRKLMIEKASDWWTEGFDERSGYGVPFPSNFLEENTEEKETTEIKNLLLEIKENIKHLNEKIEKIEALVI